MPFKVTPTSFPGARRQMSDQNNSLAIIFVPIFVYFIPTLKGLVQLCSLHKASLKNLSCTIVCPSG